MENLIGSLQEGEEWIARLESDVVALQQDIISAQGILTDIGIGSLQYSLDRTTDLIEEIRLEMMLLAE